MGEHMSQAMAEGPSGDSAERRLVVAADLLSIRAIGPWLEEATEELTRVIGDVALAAETKSQFELALQELAVNIVTHGYGEDVSDDSKIALTWNLVTQSRDAGTTVTVVVRDTAAPYAAKPDRQADLDEPQVHGYGLLLIEQLVDSFSHERANDANVWTLLRHL